MIAGFLLSNTDSWNADFELHGSVDVVEQKVLFPLLFVYSSLKSPSFVLFTVHCKNILNWFRIDAGMLQSHFYRVIIFKVIVTEKIFVFHVQEIGVFLFC